MFNSVLGVGVYLESAKTSSKTVAEKREDYSDVEFNSMTNGANRMCVSLSVAKL